MRQATQPQRRIEKAGGEGGSDGGTPKPDSASGASDSGQHRQFLGTPHDAIPQVDLTCIDSKRLPQGVTMNDVNLFDTMYKEHCEVSIRPFEVFKFDLSHVFFKLNKPCKKFNLYIINQHISKCSFTYITPFYSGEKDILDSWKIVLLLFWLQIVQLCITWFFWSKSPSISHVHSSAPFVFCRQYLIWLWIFILTW